MPLADCSVVNPFSNQILLVLSLIVSEHWLCSECMPVDSTQMTGDPSGGNMWWRFQLSYSDHVRPLCVMNAVANFPQSRRVLRIPKKKIGIARHRVQRITTLVRTMYVDHPFSGAVSKLIFFCPRGKEHYRFERANCYSKDFVFF